MLGKKMVSLQKLAKRVKASKSSSRTDRSSSSDDDMSHYNESLLREYGDDEETDDQYRREEKTPTGFLAVYAGAERRRFVVPTRFLSHPLFKMLLEKAETEFGFQQPSGLVVPCSVATFREVVGAVQCTNGRFDFGELVQDFL